MAGMNKEFNPVDYGLDPIELCESNIENKPRIGIGLDSAVIPIRGTELSLLQTCDYFYPIVDDPYLMGRITCANVMSDLFAMGVTKIDSLDLIMQNSTNMTEKEINVVVPLLIKGFQAAASEVQCKASLSTITENPWCTIGGIATAVCRSTEFIIPDKAEKGDVIVLTKALGTQIACSIHHWIDIPEKWSKIKDIIKKEDLDKLLGQAVCSMARLNHTAAVLMHKYNAHCCTDVTGFGILGHANNLAKFQKNQNLKFILERLPVFQNVDKIAKTCNMSKLEKGICPETSGGLLICMSHENARLFCQEIESLENEKAWIVGHVEEGDGNPMAVLVSNPEIIQAESTPNLTKFLEHI
ncbi:hypothetical protein RUM44_013238 [Polyplax serrata]|uniref:Selenide, water dikinase n=1 Tax=Polyplax serrata TaxID=468196 RepID=A0ABR1BH83_POLSC